MWVASATSCAVCHVWEPRARCSSHPDSMVMAFLEITELTGKLGLNDARLSWKRLVKTCQIWKHAFSVTMS